MSWILFYDQPNTTNQFHAELTHNNGIPVGPCYPKASTTTKHQETNTTTITWDGEYTTDETGRGKVKVNNRNFLYLFYNMSPTEPNIHFRGESFLVTSSNYLEIFTYLMEHMGLNVVEENDMITTWTLQMEQRPFTLITIIENDNLNELLHLNVDGFNQYHRILVAMEPLNYRQLERVRNEKQLKEVEEVISRIRPSGKFIVEWGGIFTQEFQ